MKPIPVLLSSLLASCLLLTACKSEKEVKREPEAAKVSEADRFRGKVLNVLCWEGYADPKFVKAFEDKYGVTVKRTHLSSNDELVAKLRSGGGDVYDVVTPSSDVAGSLVQAGLVQPIDTSKLTSYGELVDLLRNVDIQKDGKIYGVPFIWGPNYLIYDANVTPEEPTSWSVMFDPKYKGKVTTWDDISNIYLVAQLAGVDRADRAILYGMSDEQLAQAKAKLLELKPQLRKLWASAGELNDLFKNKEVVLAVGWSITPHTLNKEGMNLKVTIPKEGTTGYIDRLMIPAGSKNKELAELFIDFVTQAKVMAQVAEVTGYSVANPKAAEFMPADLVQSTRIKEMATMFERVNFWQPVKNRKVYNEIWNEVKGAN